MSPRGEFSGSVVSIARTRRDGQGFVGGTHPLIPEQDLPPEPKTGKVVRLNPSPLEPGPADVTAPAIGGSSDSHQIGGGSAARLGWSLTDRRIKKIKFARR